MKSISIGRIRPGGRHRPENIPHVLGMSLQVFPRVLGLPPLSDISPPILRRQNRYSQHVRQGLRDAHIFTITLEPNHLG
jgi:hypothetical protein